MSDMESHLIYHMSFDLFAVAMAIIGGWAVYHWQFKQVLPETVSKIGTGYFFFLSFGSIAGAYLFGTLNLYASGIEGIGRSILGALFGATCMVEIYKLKRGAKGSTGYIYVVPFTVVVIIGRMGCFFSGIHDQTHGVETNMPWGWDYGDHVLRHPVQLYESLSMLVFLLSTIIILKFSKNIMIRHGFYLCVGFYAAQRFVWEFFKPYGDVIVPLNIFQLLCIVIVLYSTLMIARGKHDSHAA